MKSKNKLRLELCQRLLCHLKECTLKVTVISVLVNLCKMVSQFKVRFKIKKLFRTFKKTTKINTCEQVTSSKLRANNSLGMCDSSESKEKPQNKSTKLRIQIQDPMRTNKRSCWTNRGSQNMTHVEISTMKSKNIWQSREVQSIGLDMPSS